jgi:hypothetical protein
MKKTGFIIAAFICFGTLVNAQESALSKNFGFGFQLGQYQKDFGLGINLTSPYFAGDRIAIRVRGNMMFNEHLSEKTITWTPYSNLSIGVVSVAGEIGNFMRLYGEGGFLMLFPNSDFSSESIEMGGYGLFGFEFFFYPKGNYFIEIGGVGTGATADKVLTNPIYSNGLLINAGFRFQL